MHSFLLPSRHGSRLFELHKVVEGQIQAAFVRLDHAFTAVNLLVKMSFDRDKLKSAVAKLAAQGVYIGTSSWKYAGWFGQIYDESKYITRGKFSESRFERDCLPK